MSIWILTLYLIGAAVSILMAWSPTRDTFCHSIHFNFWRALITLVIMAVLSWAGVIKLITFQIRESRRKHNHHLIWRKYP